MSRRRDHFDEHVILRHFHLGDAADEAGRADEAIFHFREAAQRGDVACQTNLGTQLTNPNRGGADWAEGMRWYRRAARAGDPMAAWNLAMSYRLRGNRRRYLTWVRAAAALGDEEAGEVLAEIERRRAAGQAWPMYMSLLQDTDTVIDILRRFRQGEMTAAAARTWAGPVAGGEAALELQRDPGGLLQAVLDEMAAKPLTRQRALELIHKLSALTPPEA
jgi:hypothetical protein